MPVIAQASIVVAPGRPEWGAGIVVSIAGRHARVFFLEGGRRTVDLSVASLSVARPARDQVGVFSAVARTSPADWAGRRCHHRVYAVLLASDVRRNARFAAKNPLMQPRKPCVYVGLTGLSPEERFENHKADYKAGRFAADGQRLLPELYERFNPMPWAVGTAFEPYLADSLRRAGYGVWQN